MAKHDIVTAILLDDDSEITLVEVCQNYHLPEEIVIELVQLGLFQDHLTIETLRFNAEKLARIESASRLLHDLKINTSGVVLALELLDQIEQLRQEVSILQRLSEE
jgi:chaperone modulatory protein CbpM